MIIGIGIDAVDISQVKRLHQQYQGKFLNRLFTKRELSYCLNKPRPDLHLAARFAAKEAVAKCLGTGKRGFSWKEIEVVNDSAGKPNVFLTGKAAAIAKQRQIDTVIISLSFTNELAFASALSVKSQ